MTVDGHYTLDRSDGAEQPDMQAGTETFRPPQQASRRLDQLDSLRGLAAVTVCIHHLLITLPPFEDYPDTSGVGWLIYSPLHIMWAGSEAVLLFFLLSGFVLSLPFFDRPVSTRSFLVRRICRIAIPYWVAVALAAIVASSIPTAPVVGLSHWFNGIWQTPITAELLIQHGLLIDSFDVGALVPVIWSLVHEMRISLLFPLLMLPIIRLRWPVVLAASYVLGVAGTAATVLGTRILHVNQDYTQTLEYVPIFVSGALIAKHRTELVSWFNGLSSLARLTLLAAAPCAYTYQWVVHDPRPYFHFWNIADNTMTTLGAALFVLVALASPTLTRILLLRPLVVVGRASYSLYLLHTIVLVGLVHALVGHYQLPVVIAAVVVMTALATWLSYTFVERPAIAIGKRLTARITTSAIGAPGH